MKKQRRGPNRYNVLHDIWRSLVCHTNQQWLHNVARTADQLQLDTAVWISDNIYHIQTQKKQPSKVNREPSMYICLAKDPTLQQRVEDAADNDLTISPEEEEQLLNKQSPGRLDPPPILDCDVE